jgi:hypothetical protein
MAAAEEPGGQLQLYSKGRAMSGEKTTEFSDILEEKSITSFPKRTQSRPIHSSVLLWRGAL